MSGAVHLLLGAPEVEQYLKAHELSDAEVALETIMLQPNDDDPEGRPCVLFAIRLDDGSRVLTSVSYRVLQTAMAGMFGALQRRQPERDRPSCNPPAPMRAVYSCGCSHHKVELGMCGVYAPDGTVRR